MDEDFSMKGIVAATLGVLFLVLVVAWVVQGNDFFLYKAFAPKYEQVRRDTFEQSKAYRHGVVQDLERMRMDYAGAKTQEEKDAIASAILHQASEFDEDALPADLRLFVRGLRNERLESNR